jgi:ABC-type phosphate transport system substrate-binding protein
LRNLLRALLIVAVLPSSHATLASEEAGIIFIVNPSNPVTELTMREVADFYFKRAQRWPDGAKVRFIDQKDNTAQKRLFAERVLHKSPRDLDLFWIGEKNFSGQGAPIQAPNDDLVLSMVSSLPTAIGYVSASQANLANVKRVAIKSEE